MATHRTLWIARSCSNTIKMFSKEPRIDETYKRWVATGWQAHACHMAPDKCLKIISKTIKKPWRQSKCRVFITIKEA